MNSKLFLQVYSTNNT